MKTTNLKLKQFRDIPEPPPPRSISYFRDMGIDVENILVSGFNKDAEWLDSNFVQKIKSDPKLYKKGFIPANGRLTELGKKVFIAKMESEFSAIIEYIGNREALNINKMGGHS